MTKIIKEGNPNILGIIECPICGCVFSYEKEDVVEIKPNCWTIKKIIKCPYCLKTAFSFNEINQKYKEKICFNDISCQKEIRILERDWV